MSHCRFVLNVDENFSTASITQWEVCFTVRANVFV